MATRMKVRKNDQVLVTAGRDKGKRGRVIEVQTKKGRIVVEGVNVAKKAVKPNRQRGIAGGIVERESPIDISKLLPKFTTSPTPLSDMSAESAISPKPFEAYFRTSRRDRGWGAQPGQCDSDEWWFICWYSRI